jgi:hypothetical protein
LATLKLKYEELGKRKDKAAVKEVDLQFSGEREQFEILERSTKQALKPLSKAVEEALFYRARGETWYPGQEWDGRLDDDVQRELLKRSSDGYIYVNEGHPKIRPAVEALSKMEAFVGKVSPEFCEAYEEEYEDELSFTAKGFWERHV